MTGRQKVEKYSLLLKLIVKFSKLTPSFLFRFLWAITDASEKSIPLLIRYLYVKKYSNNCGNNIFIGKYVTIKNIQMLSLEDNISIHAYCYVDAYGGIEIGKDVSIANHTTLVSFEHTWKNYEKPIKYNKTEAKKITIENDIWIGSGCRILSGTIIHQRSIIAAGAVVNKIIPKQVIAGGVPCRILKEIDYKVEKK